MRTHLPCPTRIKLSGPSPGAMLLLCIFLICETPATLARPTADGAAEGAAGATAAESATLAAPVTTTSEEADAAEPTAAGSGPVITPRPLPASATVQANETAGATAAETDAGPAEVSAETSTAGEANPSSGTAVAAGEISEPETADATPQAPLNAELQALAAEFFSWRARQQPASGDDIPRVERPAGWLPAFSPQDLAIYRVQYRDFLERLSLLDNAGWTLADQVDGLLLASAIKRVGWELDGLNAPQRNPLFYVDQSLGSVFELLVLSTPITEQRLAELMLRLNHFPELLEYARDNLSLAVKPFAEVTISTLANIDEVLAAVQTGLEPHTPAPLHADLAAAFDSATAALEGYRDWLQQGLEQMNPEFALGEQSYQWFLAHIALIPHTPAELLAQGRQAWNRAVAWDVLERQRNRDMPELPVFESAAAQIEASFRNEQEIRNFLEQRGLMTVPDRMMHYRNRLIPSYLKPLAFLGMTDDLTSETRLDEDAYSYIPEPAADLPFFQRASAMDPRPLIAHEGVPGHYFQLALSWAHPDPIRRRFIDSGANEGIGFYVEEMLLQSGLFSFSPRSREIIYRFMRLRALRVEVDIRLATGDFTIDDAADYLARTVPMDRATAEEEAVFFAFNPGQAISYQVGALQIHRFLTDAALDQGEDFSLRAFHDFLLLNGNVPIALQRWQYLGRDDDIQRLNQLARPPITVPY